MKFQQLVATSSDINQHLLTLKKYASKCASVTELGVRDVISTWAWVDAEIPKITAYDIEDPPSDNLKEVVKAAEHLDFTFVKADVLEIELEPVDLLFIDTLHTYKQLTQELKLHADKAKKYIIFHDTTLYAHQGEDGSPLGLKDALNEFLLETSDWEIEKVFTHNNGLTILKRING